MPYTLLASWLRSATPPLRSASTLWKNINKSTSWLKNSLCWLPGSGLSILLGKDRISGMETFSDLSPDLISTLNSKQILFLFQAASGRRSDSLLNFWKSSHELGLPADLAAEWTSFCHHLANTGIQLTTSDDQPMWTGGDRSGYLTVQNVYLEIVNYNWPNATGGWKHRIWSWSLPLKIKLFSWLTLANKINTWDVLQKKGWIGPSICQLCFLEEESAQHIFIHSAFARSVWAIITAALNLNHTWDGHTFPDCFEHWSKISYLTLNLPPLVCWFTWTERNNYIFENRPPSTTSVAYKSLGLLPYLERLSPKS